MCRVCLAITANLLRLRLRLVQCLALVTYVKRHLAAVLTPEKHFYDFLVNVTVFYRAHLRRLYDRALTPAYVVYV